MQFMLLDFFLIYMTLASLCQVTRCLSLPGLSKTDDQKWWVYYDTRTEKRKNVWVCEWVAGVS